MDNLKKLLKLCKSSIDIHINNHNNDYKTIDKYFETLFLFDEELINEIGIEIFNKIKDTNTLIEIRAYPVTPIGSYTLYHYDIELAINKMIEIIENEN